MLLDKYENRYIVKGILRTNTPLHIGAGRDSFNPVQTDNGVIVDPIGNPFIPGSSLKGVLRSYIESVVNSGIDSKLKSCLIVNKPCLTKDKVDQIKDKYKEDDHKDLKVAQEIYSEMCDVCKIFGSHYFASKITIRDCTLKSEKAYIQKRDGVAIDRETGTAADGKKYDYEQVAAGTDFDFYMSVDNLEDERVDIFKLAVKALADGNLHVGGKTSYGLGNIQLVNYKIYRITSDNLKQYLMEGLSDEMRWNYV